MPIRFSSIPEQIQLSVVHKLNFEDYQKVHGSSRETNELAKKTRVRHPRHFNSIRFSYWNENFYAHFEYDRRHISIQNVMTHPVRMVSRMAFVYDDLSENLCSGLVDFVLNMHIKSRFFQIGGNVICSPESFSSLIDALKVEDLNFRCQIAPEVLTQSDFTNVKNLTIDMFLKDVNLSALKMPNLHLPETNASSSDINLLLKEWMNGEREIERYTICTVMLVDRQNILDGIQTCPGLIEDEKYVVNGKNQKLRIRFSWDGIVMEDASNEIN